MLLPLQVQHEVLGQSLQRGGYESGICLFVSKLTGNLTGYSKTFHFIFPAHVPTLPWDWKQLAHKIKLREYL